MERNQRKKLKKLKIEYKSQPLSFDNTSFLSYRYAFDTRIELTNLYSDLTLTTLNLRSGKWYYLENPNKRLCVDEFENDVEERTSFLPESDTTRQSSVSSFFSTNMIDMPRCFQKSESMFKPIFNKPYLKLLHILMRHGKKEQIFAQLLKIFIKHKIHFSNYSLQDRNR